MYAHAIFVRFSAQSQFRYTRILELSSSRSPIVSAPAFFPLDLLHLLPAQTDTSYWGGDQNIPGPRPSFQINDTRLFIPFLHIDISFTHICSVPEPTPQHKPLQLSRHVLSYIADNLLMLPYLLLPFVIQPMLRLFSPMLLMYMTLP